VPARSNTPADAIALVLQLHSLRSLPIVAPRISLTWGVVACFLLLDFPVPGNLASPEERWLDCLWINSP
jgi:hypothetical protein